MKDFRFIFYAATSAFYVLRRAIPASNKIIAKGDKATNEERFGMAWEIVQYMRRHFNAKTYVYGMENIPKEDGYVVYSNHQSKYDALCIFEAMERYTSVLWERKSADRILARQICDLLDAVQIDLQDPHDIVKAMRRSAELVNSGRNMMIFPEGGYKDNRNTLQEFNSGCFSVSLKTKAPIVPVVLYDAYKAMNTNYLGKTTTQIHILPVIPYEEYKDMNKKELAAYVKNIIQNKLDELASGNPDTSMPEQNISKIMD